MDFESMGNQMALKSKRTIILASLLFFVGSLLAGEMGMSIITAKSLREEKESLHHQIAMLELQLQRLQEQRNVNEEQALAAVSPPPTGNCASGTNLSTSCYAYRLVTYSRPLPRGGSYSVDQVLLRRPNGGSGKEEVVILSLREALPAVRNPDALSVAKDQILELSLLPEPEDSWQLFFTLSTSDIEGQVRHALYAFDLHTQVFRSMNVNQFYEGRGTPSLSPTHTGIVFVTGGEGHPHVLRFIDLPRDKSTVLLTLEDGVTFTPGYPPRGDCADLSWTDGEHVRYAVYDREKKEVAFGPPQHPHSGDNPPCGENGRRAREGLLREYRTVRIETDPPPLEQ